MSGTQDTKDTTTTSTTPSTTSTVSTSNKDIDVSNYGIFSNGISTVKTLGSDVETGISSLNTYKSTLTSDTVFMGPICDSCANGFTKLFGKLDILKTNMGTIADYLIETSSDYQSSDANAKKKFLTIDSEGRISVATHKVINTGNAVHDSIYNYLAEQGFNDAAIAGIMANINHECGFNPNAYGDGGTSYGICQWHADRFTALQNYCSQNGLDYTSVDGQLAYLMYELKTGYSGVYNTLMSVPNTADGAYQAAYRWTYDFERPANTEGQAQSRGSQAVSDYWPIYSS